ncbi:hypothetical protein V492_08142 [Pseudogymnoascus sp. VKM F-4246]|nr:hypothetical protein V492_08142 [Pseudogymnoascus sp. VKM F-4246]
MGIPILASSGEDVAMDDEDEEWGGIGDEPEAQSVPNGEPAAALDGESKEGEAAKPAKKKRRKAKKKT